MIPEPVRSAFNKAMREAIADKEAADFKCTQCGYAYLGLQMEVFLEFGEPGCPNAEHGRMIMVKVHSKESNMEAMRRVAFRNDIQDVINRHSRENKSGTPDFILAEYLTQCLEAFDNAHTARKQWHQSRDTLDKTSK